MVLVHVLKQIWTIWTWTCRPTWKALARALAPSFSKRFLPATNTLSLSGAPRADDSLWHPVRASAKIYTKQTTPLLTSQSLLYVEHVQSVILSKVFNLPFVNTPFLLQSLCHSCWASAPSRCGRRGSSAVALFPSHRLAQRHCRSGPTQSAWLPHILMHFPETAD